MNKTIEQPKTELKCQYSRCKQKATDIYANDINICYNHKQILEINDRRYQKRLERFQNNKYFKR